MSKQTPAPRTSGLLQIVGLLLILAAFLLVWVGVGAVRASRDRSVRSGLDYEAFLSALTDLLEETADSTLLRFDEVEKRLTGRQNVTFDTLVILADVREFPAFDQAGFLYDQVQVFNRFQRDRFDLARTDPLWWDRLRAYNPSVFRSQRRPDGSKSLSRSPLAWGLRVPSPMEGEWNGEVQAKDVIRGSGLLGPRMSISLRKPASVQIPVKNRTQLCEFVPAAADVRVYCLSEERIAQATLRLAQEDRRQDWALAGWADLWVDGSRISSGDSVRIEDGSVLRLDPLEPVVFGEHWEGVLSSKQWINGRMRRRSDAPPPLDLFSNLGMAPGSSDSNGHREASVQVSVRAEASLDLTSRLKDFLDEEVDLPTDFGTMVIARIPDGEILAVAEVGRRKNRGRSSLLERVAPGSAVKPLLAAAILSQRPELGDLTVPARSGRISSVLGMPGVGSRRLFATALNCPSPREGRVDLRYYLRCSNNEYAASLLIAGLTEEGVPGSNWRGAAELPLQGRQVPRTTLLLSPLSEGLSELFDLPTDPAISDATTRSRRVWEGMKFSDGSPFRVPFELLPSESRPALLAPGSPDGTDLSLLYRYSYGAWENQWTLLDLVNGFARVTTDRRVQIRFSPSPDTLASPPARQGFQGAGGSSSGTPQGPPGTPRLPPGSRTEAMADTLGLAGHLGLADHPWYRDFLSGLAAVGIDGTAGGLRSAWRREGLPPILFSKTGTLNEPGEATPSDDLFSKSLLFALGSGTLGSPEPLTCGIVGGVYLRFKTGPRSGNLPSYQVEFARRRLGDFLQDYWEEFGACPGEGG